MQHELEPIRTSHARLQEARLRPRESHLAKKTSRRPGALQLTTIRGEFHIEGVGLSTQPLLR